MPTNHHRIRVRNSLGRSAIRRRLAVTFLKEAPGTGNQDRVERNIYHVQALAPNRWIELRRPATLNKGFDFLIYVVGQNFSRPEQKSRFSPRLSEISEDFRQKKTSNPVDYVRLYRAVKDVYECVEPTPRMWRGLRFSVGIDVKTLLHITKWFFIEQDMTYWSYSGRMKFFESIVRP